MDVAKDQNILLMINCDAYASHEKGMATGEFSKCDLSRSFYSHS